MDLSYRVDSPPHRHPADLELTWLGGEPVQGNKVKPLPLNTARLKVISQVTRGAILSIIETGHVSIEFVKRRGEQERVAEIFVVSGDGQEICIEQMRSDGPAISDHCANSDQSWKTFSFDTLPEKYWKKYSYACRFVDLVKSKTAKVTMYSDRAKGVLMENWPPNFEASFFNGGPKIVMCGNEVHIKEDSGASLMFHRDSLNNLVNSYTMDLIQHTTQMWEQCLRLEASISTVQAMSQNAEPQLFPVTVGMRPSTSFCSSTSSNSGSMDLLSSSCSGHLHPSPPSSQGQPASPPPSPLPHLDLRFAESPRKFVPTSHSSPATLDRTAPCTVTSESPLRHVSTLEGRKMRRQMSSSAGSSFLHDDSAAHSAALSSDPATSSHNAAPSPLISEDRGGPVGPETTPGSGCAAHIFGAQMDLSQHFLPSSPCRPSAASKPGQHGLVQGQTTAPAFFAAAAAVPMMSHSEQEDYAALTFSTQSYDQAAACDAVSHCTPIVSRASQELERFVEQNGPSSSSCVNGGDRGIVLHRTSEGELSPALNPHVPVDPTSGMGPSPPSAASELEEEMSPVMRQTFVAYTGWATQLANGTIWIRYNEGTQLGVNRDQTEVVYVDQEGNRHRYQRSDRIPVVVRQKLERLPSVVNSLYARPSAPPFGIAST